VTVIKVGHIKDPKFGIFHTRFFDLCGSLQKPLIFMF